MTVSLLPMFSSMNLNTHAENIERIFLCPRPYAQLSGQLLLLPLLPYPKPLKPLPSEIWTEIFAYVLQDDDTAFASPLLRVCKAFKETALPLIYSHVQISGIPRLEKFYAHLHSAEQKWDSIRRIPYSAPGRWVQILDLSSLDFVDQSQALRLDSLLTGLFPLLPFLSRLSMNPSFILSHRAMTAFTERETSSNANIRILEGISYVPTRASGVGQDPLVRLLGVCVNLEALEVICEGPHLSELEFASDDALSTISELSSSLNLPKLHTLILLRMHTSRLMMSLLCSALPSLRKITLTPYDDIPYPASLASQFIAVHGKSLRSLLLFTPESWPTRLHPSPSTLLDTSPNLRHLSLENPLPELRCSDVHPLQILSIPRPNPRFWSVFVRLLPRLPNFCVLRTRDVRWLRKGMNSQAQEAGVQGEMLEWKKRLGRWRIRLLDADWNENV